MHVRIHENVQVDGLTDSLSCSETVQKWEEHPDHTESLFDDRNLINFSALWLYYLK